MNLKAIFGQKLKEALAKKKTTYEIGTWAFSFYWENIVEIDKEFSEVLLTLNKMELGPEFAFSYERLSEIADDLIAGRDVNLDY